MYVSPLHQRRGLGRAVLEELIRRARASGVHSIVAGISADHEGSIALHTRLGFAPAGLLREVGEKFERTLDVIYLQLLLRAVPGA